MQASIITIGDEILIGQVVDTNSAYMAEELSKLGIKTSEIASISDTREAILSTIQRFTSENEIVLVTGGLGPTKDDITKKVLADFFNCKLIRHQPTLETIEKRLTSVNVKMSEINRGQADVPEVCTILPNQSGSAPGMLFKTDKGILISMPGVPFEMKDLMQNEVLPYIRNNYDLPARMHLTFLTTGVAESTMADRLEGFEGQLPDGFSLAYLPSPGNVRLRLTGSGENKGELEKEFDAQCIKLRELLGNDLFGYDNETLALTIGKLLSDNKFTVATAESCTGGNIGKTIISVPGASNYFSGSVVAYSNKSKAGLLNVSEQILDDHGAVSEEVVVQMAENVKKMFGADFGIATSGISGPGGGTIEKPVGTVWIALASPRRTLAIKYNMGNHRERTLIRSTIRALDLLRKEILSIVEKTENKV